MSACPGHAGRGHSAPDCPRRPWTAGSRPPPSAAAAGGWHPHPQLAPGTTQPLPRPASRSCRQRISPTRRRRHTCAEGHERAAREANAARAHISVTLQPPQLTCAIWLAVSAQRVSGVPPQRAARAKRTLHRQVHGVADGALHAGGPADVHEQRAAATTLQLRHLRACRGVNCSTRASGPG